MTAGILALLIPCCFGLLLARRVFRLTNPLEFVPVGLTSGWMLNAMMTNLALRAGGSTEQALTGAALALTAAGALLWAVSSKPEFERPRLSLLGWAYLLGFTGLVYFTSVSILFLNPDDDFWLHAPMQAQLLKGNFPIRNPVFPELSYGGHYARDLSMVAFSWWSGINLYASQAPVTAFLQVNAFWLIFAAGLRYGKSDLTAIFASLFLFMGVNAAGRGGWLDTVSNNNPIAQVHTALLIFLFIKILFEEVDWGQVVATGVLFAGLAWSYETNFVALSLSLVTFALIVTAKRQLTKRQLAVTGVIIVVALLFMGLQGGLLGELFEKVASRGQAHKVEIDATTQAQNLEVSVQFPKEEMFQIKLSRASDEISMAYHTFPWFRQFDITPQEPGYVSVFSPSVWRIHWLSLYLCPLVFLVLWRMNNRLGQLLWGFGLASYFIPAVINFGIWEVEVFRWEYAASCGFAGALGVVIGEWLAGLKGEALVVDDKQVRFAPKFAAWLGVLLLSWLNCYPTWVQVERRTSQLPGWEYGFLLPSTDTWMAFHPVLGLQPSDLRTGYAVAPLVKKGDRFLMNRQALGPSDIFPESAFVGLVGAQTIGHAFPLQCERVGTMPFRQGAHAIAFWRSGDLELLRNRELQWLYVREDGSQPPSLSGEGLEEVHREASPSGERVFYRVKQEPFPNPQLSETPHSDVRVEEVAGTENLGNEDYRLLRASFSGSVPSNAILTYRFYHPESGEMVKYEEGLSQPFRPGAGSFAFHFVAPHNPGAYLVKLYLGTSEEQNIIGQFEIEPVQLKAFQELRVEWAESKKPLHGGIVETVELRFSNPTGAELEVKGFASLTASSTQHPNPPQDFQRIAATVPPESSAVVPLRVVPPPEAGTWPFKLVLSPKDGKRSFDLPARVVGY